MATTNKSDSPSAHTTPKDSSANDLVKHEKGPSSSHDELDSKKKIILDERENRDVTGFAWSPLKRWSILTVIFIVQSSMNFNAAVYGNAVKPLSEHFGISEQGARVGQMIFLVAYAFGCELWAPWSEEYGRWPILQLSLFLVNIWAIPCALAKNFGTIIVCRALGGLSSAGGSVTLGMVADMWEHDDQQYAVAYVVFSSVFGSVLGPIVGAFLEEYLDWRWIFWMQLIFGGCTQILHFFVPETRSSILLTREAKRRRKNGENVWGPDEASKTLSPKMVITTWVRPFEMFVREPIVLWLSLLSGFSDALIFTFLESYGLVYKQWNFGTIQIGLSFIPIAIGYFIAWASFIPSIHSQRQKRRKDPWALRPEARLWWLLYTAPLLAIGLFGFAWTSLGPPRVHWIAPMLFSVLVGIANYSIYMATIDYMVAAYGPYSSSATGGNGLARDFLAGIAAMYSIPMYSNIGKSHPLEWASTILAILAVIFTIPIYVFYTKGPQIRERSKFAQTLDSDRKKGGVHPATENEKARAGNLADESV